MLLSIFLLKRCCKRCYFNWFKRCMEKPDFYIPMLNGAYQKTKIQTQWDPVFRRKKERKNSSLQLRALSNSIIWMKFFQGNNETRTFLLNQINASSVLVSKCDNCQIFWARCNQFPVCYCNSFPCYCTGIRSYILPNAILWSQIGGSIWKSFKCCKIFTRF